MQSFALVTLLGALFTTGVTAGPFKRYQPTDIPSSVLFSFSDTPPSVSPSGSGVPPAMATGAPGSGGSIYICHPIDPSAVPAPNPDNATLSAIPSGPVPTSAPTSDSNLGTGAPPTPTSGAPQPTGSQGSGGPIYVCYPADSGAIPAPNASAPAPASITPSASAPGSTDSPNSVPVGSQPSGGPSYFCYPADSAGAPTPSAGTPGDATPTPVPSGPVTTSDPSATP